MDNLVATDLALMPREYCYVSHDRHLIDRINTELEKMDDPKAARAVHLADVLLQNYELGKADNSSANRTSLRDQMMAKNALWILGQEEQRGNSAIFLSGHNGHMERKGFYGPDAKVMGHILSDELGEAYYAIGTDFYHAECNLPGSNGKRICHPFYSYDPLAKAARKCGFDMCWLDFSAVPDDSLLKEDLTGYIWMGSLGELYSWIMNVLPMSYRVWRSPAEMYDSLILVTDAHPTEIYSAVD